MPEKFNNLLPTRGFLREYVEWTRNTEPPTSFHFFTALSILGAAAERRTWVDQGLYKIFPAGAYVLVAPTGICRKSTCTKLGVNVLRKALPEYLIISEKATPEGLASVLSRTVLRGRDIVSVDAICLIHAPELGVLLGRQTYNEGLVILLTSLIDAPDEFDSRLAGGDRLLKNVAISILGASNPDWLSSALPVDAHGGGFLSRVLYIVEQTTDRCFPRPPRLDEPARQRLKEHLRKIHEVPRGEFKLTPEAEQWFDKWYRDEGRALSTIEGLESRRPDHTIRLAMNLAISQEDEAIEVEHFEHALEILTHVLSRQEFEVGEMAIADDAMFQIKKVLMRFSEIQHTMLLRKLVYRGIDSETIQRKINTLEQAGLVEVEDRPKEKGKEQRGRWYRWKGKV